MNESELSKLLDEALDDLLDGKSKCEKQKPLETKEQVDLKEALNLKESLEKISEVGGVDDDMNKFFEELNAKLQSGEIQMDPNEAKARLDESVPQIFDMMQSLLSKELLLPALNDLLPKFNLWLDEKSASLSKADRKRYRKQCSVIKEILNVFDDETLDDKEKFERNMNLMEKMQSLGSPPDDLVVPTDGLNRCSIS